MNRIFEYWKEGRKEDEKEESPAFRMFMSERDASVLQRQQNKRKFYCN